MHPVPLSVKQHSLPMMPRDNAKELQVSPLKLMQQEHGRRMGHNVMFWSMYWIHVLYCQELTENGIKRWGFFGTKIFLPKCFHDILFPWTFWRPTCLIKSLGFCVLWVFFFYPISSSSNPGEVQEIQSQGWLASGGLRIRRLYTIPSSTVTCSIWSSKTKRRGRSHV